MLRPLKIFKKKSHTLRIKGPSYRILNTLNRYLHQMLLISKPQFRHLAYFNIAFLYFFTRLKFSSVTPVPGEIITISPSQSSLFHFPMSMPHSVMEIG